MSISRSELIDILNSIDIEFELDSSKPGVITQKKEHISYSSLKLPSEYFGNFRGSTYQFVSECCKAHLSYKETGDGRKYFQAQCYTEPATSSAFKNNETVYSEVLAA